MRSSSVSVIVPTFNGQRFLLPAVESVVRQTYQEWEIIIVDDGSTDGSEEFVRRCSQLDSRIRCLRKSNGGLSSARNFGIDAAIGDYVAFLDDDDFWHESKLRKHVEHLDENPEVGVSYSGTRFVNVEGLPLRHFRVPKCRELDDFYIYCRNPITNGSNGVFRREVFSSTRFDESLPRNQDVDCWLRIAFGDGWKLEGIPDLLTFYRVNPSGISTDYYKHLECARRVWKKSYEYAPEVAGRYASLAEAFQLRFYARRALSVGDRKTAAEFVRDAVRKNWRFLAHEPISGMATVMGALVPGPLLKALCRRAM